MEIRRASIYNKIQKKRVLYIYSITTWYASLSLSLLNKAGNAAGRGEKRKRKEEKWNKAPQRGRYISWYWWRVIKSASHCELERSTCKACGSQQPAHELLERETRGSRSRVRRICISNYKVPCALPNSRNTQQRERRQRKRRTRKTQCLSCKSALGGFQQWLSRASRKINFGRENIRGKRKKKSQTAINRLKYSILLCTLAAKLVGLGQL